MNFSDLSKFITSIGKTYNVPCYDICIYYDHVNVFRSKRITSSFSQRMKSIGRNYYFMQSGTKIMTCVALMRLIQGYKASLDDSVCKYLPEFPQDVTIRTMISEYSRIYDSNEKVFSFTNIRKLISAIAGMPFEEYVTLKITGPLKMKQTSFNLTSKSRKKIALQYRFDDERLCARL